MRPLPANVAHERVNLFCEHANVTYRPAYMICERDLRTCKRGLRTLPENFDFCTEFSFKHMQCADAGFEQRIGRFPERNDSERDKISDDTVYLTVSKHRYLIEIWRRDRDRRSICD